MLVSREPFDLSKFDRQGVVTLDNIGDVIELFTLTKAIKDCAVTVVFSTIVRKIIIANSRTRERSNHPSDITGHG
jgi:hypothetical protein